MLSRWGKASWGTFQWGGGYSSTLKVEGSQSLAKDDTVFLCVNSDPDADVSQFERAWTSDGVGAYRENASEWAITGEGNGRTVEAKFRWDTAATDAVVMRVGSTSASNTQTFRLQANGSTVRGYRGGTIVCEVNLPEVSATRNTFSVWFSTRPNPLTTGAADALISELVAYNHDEDKWSEMDSGTHSVASTDPTWAASVGGRWNGAAMQAQLPEAPIICRISSAYHSSVEFAEDFVSARGANTSTDLRRAQPYLGPAGLFAAEEAFGPQAAQVNESAVQADLRMASPLWNEIFDEQAALNRANEELTHTAPGSDFALHVFFVRWVMVPPLVRHARVRLQANAWQTDATPRSCDLRVYSFDRLPQSPKHTIGQSGGGGVSPPSWAWCQASTTSQVGSSSGDGEWLDLGLLDLKVNGSLARRDNGTTFLAVAFRVPSSNSRVAVKAINVTPAVPGASAKGFQQFGALGG